MGKKRKGGAQREAYEHLLGELEAYERLDKARVSRVRALTETTLKNILNKLPPPDHNGGWEPPLG